MGLVSGDCLRTGIPALSPVPGGDAHESASEWVLILPRDDLGSPRIGGDARWVLSE